LAPAFALWRYALKASVALNDANTQLADSGRLEGLHNLTAFRRLPEVAMFVELDEKAELAQEHRDWTLAATSRVTDKSG
jgi:hypothetical protein